MPDGLGCDGRLPLGGVVTSKLSCGTDESTPRAPVTASEVKALRRGERELGLNDLRVGGGGGHVHLVDEDLAVNPSPCQGRPQGLGGPVRQVDGGPVGDDHHVPVLGGDGTPTGDADSGGAHFCYLRLDEGQYCVLALHPLVLVGADADGIVGDVVLPVGDLATADGGVKVFQEACD